MRYLNQNQLLLVVALTLSTLLCTNQSTWALPQSSISGGSFSSSSGGSVGPINRNYGGNVGVTTGALGGSVAGVTAGAELGSSIGGSSRSSSGSVYSSSAQEASESSYPSSNYGLSSSQTPSSVASVSSSSSSSSNGGSISGGSLSTSGSTLVESNGGSISSGGSSSASVYVGASTPKPDGLFGKVKELIKESKDAIKGRKDDRKDENLAEVSTSASSSSSSAEGFQASGGASLEVGGQSSASDYRSSSSSLSSSPSSSSSSSGVSGSITSSSSQGISSGSESTSSQATVSGSTTTQQTGGLSSSSTSAGASITIGSSTRKPESILEKVSDIIKKSKESAKDTIETAKAKIGVGESDKSSFEADAKASIRSGTEEVGSSNSSIKAEARVDGSKLGDYDRREGSGFKAEAKVGAKLSTSSSERRDVDSTGSVRVSAKSFSDDRRDGNSTSSVRVGAKSFSDDRRDGNSTSSVRVSTKSLPDDRRDGNNTSSVRVSAKSYSDDRRDLGSTSTAGFRSRIGADYNRNSSAAVNSSVSLSGGGLKVEAKADTRSSVSGDSIKGAGFKAEGKVDIKKTGNDEEGPMDKISKVVNEGTKTVRETVHKIEDKAHEVEDKISKSVDEHIKKPMQSTSGSGKLTQQGQMTVQASANINMKGEEREAYLTTVKHKQEVELPNRPQNLKEIVTSAKTRGVIPRNEDRSALRGNHDDEKSMTVEVFDKAHEMSKIPVESVLKPIDKMLGYEKDPMLRFYDNTHEILRKPLGTLAKPVEQVLTGAFKTTDEAKKDSERLLATTSEQERREAKLKEEKIKKEDRSVVGAIADKTLELATKPFEIVLKPIDHVFGLDKDGKKNPLLQTLDDIYNLSKKPVDAIAKPFESILRKMADGEQLYQVSIRFNTDKDDPKLVTRLADGALNIADRVITKPLEIVMKPLNHALGFDEPGKKNPIVEAAHGLKNATKVGVELFTKPIDRIIKEIADIGDYKNDHERELALQRHREEASRIVQALDKMHDVAQAPFEIVLRPVGKVLGYNKNGRKEPLLRAWDVIHEVVTTPIQVISKPVEDAILGEKPRRASAEVRTSTSAGSRGQQSGAKVQIGGQIGGVRAGASFSAGGGASSGSRSGIAVSASASSSSNNTYAGAGNFDDENKKNIIVDEIKKVEKMYTKPLAVITSPIRKLILGEDNEKVGSGTEKNNREIQAKARAGGQNGRVAPKSGDKILTTLEKMNNVMLKPLEVITQPISDIISEHTDGEVGISAKSGGVQTQTHVGVSQSGSQAGSQSTTTSQTKVLDQGSSFVRQTQQQQISRSPPKQQQQLSASVSSSIKKN